MKRGFLLQNVGYHTNTAGKEASWMLSEDREPDHTAKGTAVLDDHVHSLPEAGATGDLRFGHSGFPQRLRDHAAHQFGAKKPIPTAR